MILKLKISGRPVEAVLPSQTESQEPEDILPEPEIDLGKVFSPVDEEPAKEPDIPLEIQEPVLPEGFAPFTFTLEEQEIPGAINPNIQEESNLRVPVGDLPLEEVEIEPVCRG